MDSRKIIVILLAILIVGLVVFLFISSMTDTAVLRVGDEKYDLDDFKSYIKVWNYEDSSDKSDISAMFDQYEAYKIYYTRAKKAGVELESGEMPAALESGDEEILLSDYDLTSGEYMRVKTEIAKANKIYASPYELAKISKSYFTDYKESILSQNESAFDTFNYRVVEIAKEQDIIEENESGEMINLSEDPSGETSGERQERYDREAKEKAEKVLALVKSYISGDSDNSTLIGSIKEIIPQLESGDDFSGDIFDYIGLNTNNSRYTQNTNGFSSVANGGLDTASRLYMESDMVGEQSYLSMFGMGELSQSIVDKVYTLEEGAVSDIFETPEGYAFVYLESVEHELSKADEDRFNTDVARNYIIQNSDYNKIPNIKVDLEKLIPKVAREAEEARKAEEEAAKNSGETAIEEVDDSVSIDVPELDENSEVVITDEGVELNEEPSEEAE